MTTTQATKIIRNYVRENGRGALRRNLNELAKLHNSELIMDAGARFLCLDRQTFQK